MGRPAHFEVRADDIDRAKKFYENVFGWETKKWDSPDPEMKYWLVMTGKMTDSPPPERDIYGIDGGMMTSVSFTDEKINSYLVTMDVEDLEETCKKIEENGGKLMTEKMTVPGAGYMRYAQDTEGNYFGMMQSDENASM